MSGPDGIDEEIFTPGCFRNTSGGGERQSRGKRKNSVISEYGGKKIKEARWSRQNIFDGARPKKRDEDQGYVAF